MAINISQSQFVKLPQLTKIKHSRRAKDSQNRD